MERIVCEEAGAFLEHALNQRLWCGKSSSKHKNTRQRSRKQKVTPSKMPARDLAMETLVEVLDGKRVMHHHTHRHDDILTVLRLKKEFGFRLVLQHVSEAWKVADEIAAAKVPASIIMIDSPGGKLETTDIKWENGSALEKAGALVGFHTDELHHRFPSLLAVGGDLGFAPECRATRLSTE